MATGVPERAPAEPSDELLHFAEPVVLAPVAVGGGTMAADWPVKLLKSQSSRLHAENELICS